MMTVFSLLTYSPRSGRHSSGAGAGLAVCASAAAANNKLSATAASDRIFIPNSQKGVLDLLQGAVENIVLAGDAEAHVFVVFVTVGEGAAGNAGHALAYQHLIESDRVGITIRDSCPHVERRTGIVNLESRVTQRL